MADTYAIIRSGGKQYAVKPGQTISVELMKGNVGDKVYFAEVMVLSNGGAVKVGTPLVSGASVSGTIVGLKKDKKVLAYRKKIKTGFTKKIGHRHARTQVKIEAIAA